MEIFHSLLALILIYCKKPHCCEVNHTIHITVLDIRNYLFYFAKYSPHKCSKNLQVSLWYSLLLCLCFPRTYFHFSQISSSLSRLIPSLVLLHSYSRLAVVYSYSVVLLDSIPVSSIVNIVLSFKKCAHTIQ
jgi:hypothetical protein